MERCTYGQSHAIIHSLLFFSKPAYKSYAVHKVLLLKFVRTKHYIKIKHVLRLIDMKILQFNTLSTSVVY